MEGTKLNKAKPFCISKKSVMAAWERVKANKGTYGVDGETIEDFGLRLKDNLYKIWNRMSSGTYFPSAVRAVEIPKSDGKKRVLGIPTVADRIAQTVVKDYLEAIVDKLFDEDSYGYRPRKSALEAVGKARERCWIRDWCLDLDIKGFFDNLDHKLMIKAVKMYTSQKWVHLYVDRWLKAPIQLENGQEQTRDKGTPQGGVISPLLANIFMHHAFDQWMRKRFPEVKFERFADDIIVHCSTREEVVELREAITKRLQACRLELHPEKTKIVYCKGKGRAGSHVNESFDFLGYTFRPRLVRDKEGKMFVGYSPAISKQAKKRIGKEIRSWKIHQRSDKSLSQLGKMYNAQVQGWINYYGRYGKSAIYSIVRRIEQYLTRWAMRKYKRLRDHQSQAGKWLRDVRMREPALFAHWRVGLQSQVG